MQRTAAIEALANHQPFFTSHVTKVLLNGFLTAEDQRTEPSLATGLTSREREIVQMLAEGRSNKEVAAVLCISVNTVETHRATIMRKLGITSIVELVHYAVRNKLIKL